MSTPNIGRPPGEQLIERKIDVEDEFEMPERWPERIVFAQQQATYLIDGKQFPRIPFGKEPEDWGAEHRPCHDCFVSKGRLHVPGCDVERCPRCGGQVISCDRPYGGEEVGPSQDNPQDLFAARTAVKKFFEERSERLEKAFFESLREFWHVTTTRKRTSECQRR